MTKHRRAIGAAGVFLTLAVPNFPASAQAPPFQFGLGNLMMLLVQPRHAKLGLAGREQNWAYAAFAAHELEETFAAVAKAVPKHRDFSIPDLMASTVKQPLEGVEQAIKARDSAGFETAYGQLTAACNICHRSTGHEVIVIQAPAASAFPNQDFRPPKK